MHMNVEIEFKTRITKEKYDELIDIFELDQNVFKQTNYYFDTPELDLNKRSMVLRIRHKRDAFKLTLKSQSETGSFEYHVLIDAEQAEKMKKDGFHTKEFFEQIDYHVYFKTSLDNFRASTPYMGGILFLDYNEYCGKTDYELEYEILNKVKSINLDVDTLYYNVANGIQLTKYIEDADHFSTEYIEEASLLIKKLHEPKIHVGKQYDIEKMFKEYQDRNHEILFDTSFAHHYISKAKQLSKEQHVLCHNDLVEGNFLFTKDQSYLIDYEYAMDNHPYFDLMSFITENDIQNPQDRERIYKIYFGDDFEAIDYEALKIFEIAHHVLWCEWASFMYNQHQEKIP